jgi:uncharacterized membrane protein
MPLDTPGRRRIGLIAARLTCLGLAIGQVLDILSTNEALAASPGVTELNPLIAATMSALGDLWWLPKSGLALLMIYFALTLRAIRRRTAVILAVTAKATVLVILGNWLSWL